MIVEIEQADGEPFKEARWCKEPVKTSSWSHTSPSPPILAGSATPQVFWSTWVIRGPKKTQVIQHESSLQLV